MATDSAMDTGERVYGDCEGPDAMWATSLTLTLLLILSLTL